MSRSDYSEDCNNLALWRGAVDSAIHGKRGQKLLSELAEAMDAMPVKELIAGKLEADGAYCALGVVGATRGVDMRGMDPEDADVISKTFNIAEALAREIAYINDEAADNHKYIDGKYKYVPETPAERWARVRTWVARSLTAHNKQALMP